MGRARPLLLFLLAGNAAALLDACGSRTGLPIDESPTIPEGDAASDALVHPDVGIDARDGSRDVTIEDALPPIDATPLPDVRRDDCPDADATLVYVIGEDNALYSFYPPTLAFKRIGTIACPGSGTPFSMAVDRKGKAYVVFTDGRLYQVSTATAACIVTPFVPNQRGFVTFGMGFVSNTGGADETLFVAQSPQTTGGSSTGLGSVDVTNWQLTYIGPFTPTLQRVEFTGTGDGRLFGYAPNDTGSQIVQVDKTTGNVLASDSVGTGTSQDAFAFAFWGGDFWIFTGVSSTAVVRYRPSDKTTANMTTAPSLIVGAGVSTCAPQ
jgi:hypothetical protein